MHKKVIFKMDFYTFCSFRCIERSKNNKNDESRLLKTLSYDFRHYPFFTYQAFA